MMKFVLKNGLVVLYEKKKSNTVAIELTVKTGSNNETAKISGISHFLEHMIFEGTNKRKTSKEISSEIEKLGGELNAYTSNERTSFYCKILKKHVDKGMDILSDIIKDPLFSPESIEKERKVILKEIDMVRDEPRFHQWILFQKALFKKHPTKNPTYGSVDAVKNIGREDILKYYNRYYVPNNIILSISGDVKDIRKKIEKYFDAFKKGQKFSKNKIIEPTSINPVKITEKRKLYSSYMVFGYKTCVRIHKDSYALDIIDSILGRGQSGRLFEEIRNKHGLAYEVGVQNEAAIDYGFFAVYLNTDKKNITKAKGIILNEIEKLKKISDKDLSEAKQQIEGSYALENDDNFRSSDNIAFWEMVKNAKLAKDYIRNIKKVTKNDIRRVVSRYFKNNYAIAVIEQE